MITLYSHFSQLPQKTISTCDDIKQLYQKTKCCTSNSTSSVTEDTWSGSQIVRAGATRGGSTRYLIEKVGNSIVTLTTNDPTSNTDEGYRNTFYVIEYDNMNSNGLGNPTRWCSFPKNAVRVGTSGISVTESHMYMAHPDFVNQQTLVDNRDFFVRRIARPLSAGGTCTYIDVDLKEAARKSFGFEKISDFLNIPRRTHSSRIVGTSKKYYVFNFNKYGDARLVKIPLDNFVESAVQMLKINSYGAAYMTTQGIISAGNFVVSNTDVDFTVADVSKEWKRDGAYVPTSTPAPTWWVFDSKSQSSNGRVDQTSLTSVHTGASGCSYMLGGQIYGRTDNLAVIPANMEEFQSFSYESIKRAVFRICPGSPTVQHVTLNSPKWGVFIEAMRVDETTGDIFVSGSFSGNNKFFLPKDYYTNAGAARYSANWETGIATLKDDSFLFSDTKQPYKYDSKFGLTELVGVSGRDIATEDSTTNTRMGTWTGAAFSIELNMVDGVVYGFSGHGTIYVFDMNNKMKVKTMRQLLTIPGKSMFPFKKTTVKTCGGTNSIYEESECCESINGGVPKQAVYTPSVLTVDYPECPTGLSYLGLTLYDSYGDAWQGSTLTLSGTGISLEPLTLTKPSMDTMYYCIPITTCVSITHSEGGYPEETSYTVSWQGVTKEWKHKDDSTIKIGSSCVQSPSSSSRRLSTKLFSKLEPNTVSKKKDKYEDKGKW